MIILSRLRYCPDTRPTPNGDKRRALERETIRCVKRYVARQIYHALRTDLAAAPALTVHRTITEGSQMGAH